ncbi:regulator of G-protein signaling 3-like isoform X2 [Lampris incognitus]|uniref:regulator of G-protein signaling 3-like isoform X2 n=1 Tax=Lampris incognitus TaxID=2546036 RepID=UPI0024B4FB20|nr:regulator of G-protein signaling 3-like isoform X2 [Lampris incognitus]
MHTIHRLCNVCIAQNLPQVRIVRGKDGFGFTICSECPVRVQSVEPDGPALQAGLLQLDCVLQLNGVPVEGWKCVDLAHAIRSCSSQIALVVWRGAPQMRPCYEGILHQPSYQPPSCQQPTLHHKTTVEKLLPHPPNSKHGRRRGQGSGARSGLGALGSLWRDRREVKEEDEVSEFSSPITTLKGTRVTSSNGDNYIILSAIDPGNQLLQPVYHDRNGTMGRLYKTQPTRGHQQNSHLLHDLQPGLSRQSVNSCTATMPPPSFSTQPGDFGNYQNCTMVQSHLPCSAYGTYVTLSPKTLIFPVFVQPLDLCSPDRSLLMSEEMILHQGDLLPAKVTVLIYSDLLLLTREEEAGHCNVLQSPLYLHTLHLQEVASDSLRLCVLQCVERWECVFILEAYSLEQKTRVTLCLQDNINLQGAFTTEPTHTQQAPLEELQSDFGLLSVSHTDFPCRASSLYTSSPEQHLLSSFPVRDFTPPPLLQSSPLAPSPPPYYTSLLKRSAEISVWMQREKGEVEVRGRRKQSETLCEEAVEERRWRRMRGEAKEERQQGEGESSSETSERAPRLHSSPSPDEEEDNDEDEEDERGVGLGYSSPFRSAGPASIRRSLSEGSFFLEPRSSVFLSDSTTHRLTKRKSFDLHLAVHSPSLNTLSSHLTKDGGSLHSQMLLLLTRGKDKDSAPQWNKKRDASHTYHNKTVSMVTAWRKPGETTGRLQRRCCGGQRASRPCWTTHMDWRSSVTS